MYPLLFIASIWLNFILLVLIILMNSKMNKMEKRAQQMTEEYNNAYNIE